MISKVKVVTKQVSESATAASEKSNHKSDPFTCFRADRRVIKIGLNDIVYIESLRDYVKVVTTSKNIVTKQSISSIEETLQKQGFVRIHRSFIVAVNKIQSYTNEMVDLGKMELPISRMYRHEVSRVLQIQNEPE